jgi:lipopolysaccharide transport system ATP-binding protein
MEFEYWNLVPGAYLNLSVVVSTEEGHPIFNTGSGGEPVWHNKPFPAGLFRSRFHIPGDLLNDGTHRVHLYVIKDQTRVIYDLDDILVFDVEEASGRAGGWYGKWIGAVRPNLDWQTELLPESPAQPAQ